MKNKVLKEIESFTSILYMFGKINVAKGAEKLFTDIVNQSWDPNKDDETNLKAVRSSFNITKTMNEFHNNSDIVTCINLFMSEHLSKF